jgi:hypothetical protein
VYMHLHNMYRSLVSPSGDSTTEHSSSYFTSCAAGVQDPLPPREPCSLLPKGEGDRTGTGGKKMELAAELRKSKPAARAHMLHALLETGRG